MNLVTKKIYRRIPRCIPEHELAAAAQRNELPQRPDESDEAYRKFLHFCAHPEMSQSDLANHFGLQQSSISDLRSRHRWAARIENWWLERRDGIEPTSEEWKARQRELREEEWELHEDLVEAAREALERWYSSDKVPNLLEIGKMLELASKLGRLAAGLPLVHAEISGNPESPIRLNVEAALERAYGGRVES